MGSRPQKFTRPRLPDPAAPRFPSQKRMPKAYGIAQLWRDQLAVPSPTLVLTTQSRQSQPLLAMWKDSNKRKSISCCSQPISSTTYTSENGCRRSKWKHGLKRSGPGRLSMQGRLPARLACPSLPVHASQFTLFPSLRLRARVLLLKYW